MENDTAKEKKLTLTRQTESAFDRNTSKTLQFIVRTEEGLELVQAFTDTLKELEKDSYGHCLSIVQLRMLDTFNVSQSKQLNREIRGEPSDGWLPYAWYENDPRQGMY